MAYKELTDKVELSLADIKAREMMQDYLHNKPLKEGEYVIPIGHSQFQVNWLNGDKTMTIVNIYLQYAPAFITTI